MAKQPSEAPKREPEPISTISAPWNETPVRAVADDASQPFVGQWNRLVSQTNWEKGRIILDWRNALIESGAAPTEYSDEAWSRLVGGVTGQHVGRLRRVWQRFATTRDDYPGLYWSHFFAALEWDDAEMWLEGAVRSGWSVSQMRRTRWETLGQVATAEQDEGELVQSELDEDFEPALRATPESKPGEVEASMPQAGIAADESSTAIREAGEDDEVDEAEQLGGESSDPDADEAFNALAEQVRPFADLPELPEDLADAMEVFKLAILSHKTAQWRQVRPEDVLRALDALKQLVLAPA